MSNISNVHSISAYTSGVTKPFAGQRLATVTYKVDKKTGVKPESVCASIPMVSNEAITANLTAFIPHIAALVERTQDNIIRTLHESKCSTVSDDAISIAAVLEYLNDTASGGRLTKAMVCEWFDNEIADNLALALATKLGVSEQPTNEQSAYIETMLASFRNSIGALSAGATKYDPATCGQLIKALSFAPADDALSVRFIARLETMQRIVPTSIVDAL